MNKYEALKAMAEGRTVQNQFGMRFKLVENGLIRVFYKNPIDVAWTIISSANTYKVVDTPISTGVSLGLAIDYVINGHVAVESGLPKSAMWIWDGKFFIHTYSRYSVDFGKLVNHKFDIYEKGCI
jgi:hypothetical protein